MDPPKSICSFGVRPGVCMPSYVLEKINEAIKNESMLEKLKRQKNKEIEPSDNLYTQGMYAIKPMMPIISENPLPDEEKAALLKNAQEKLGCDSEVCVLAAAQTLIGVEKAKQILELNYRHDGPTNRDWLSNVDIDRTLQQFMVKFKDFYAYRFNMSDFQVRDLIEGQTPQLIDESPIDVFMRTNKRRFACAFNTDTSKGGGIHWVSFFCDLSDSKEWTVEFFDSAAGEYKSFTKYCCDLHKKINDRIAKMPEYKDVNVKLVFNNKLSHQRSSSECGVYTLYYIYNRLCGVPHEYFKTTRIPDEKMYEFRKIIFAKTTT